VPCGCRGSIERALRRQRPDDDALRERLKVLAEERRRFGYRRLWVLLRREGHAVNRKRVYRLYKQERLMVDDQMTDGRRLRIFAVVDDYTREWLGRIDKRSPGTTLLPASQSRTPLSIKFQCPTARRAVERNLIPLTAACPRGVRSLALGLQCHASAFEPRLADAIGLCVSLPALVRATGQDALAI